MTNEPRFQRRFEQIWSALRNYQLRLGLAAALLVASTGLGLVAWSDYRFELSRPARALGLATLLVAVAATLWRWVVVPLRWWTRPRTAIEIEGRFPQLGQRIRTVVQYSGLGDDAIVTQGATPGLVDALNDETEAQVGPLPLDSIVPWRRIWATAAVASVPLLLLALAATRDVEWRIAVQRAVLIEKPYTTLAVLPGNIRIDQGANVTIAVDVRGRMRPKILLESRPAGKATSAWKSVKLDVPDSGSKLRRESVVEKIEDPLEYRVIAGPTRSDTFKVDVRYPLEIKEFTVTLSPPAYTGLEPSKTKGGDISAVEGTEAKLAITFDSLPTTALLEVSDPAWKPTPKNPTRPAPTVITLWREGKSFVTNMKLLKDLDYKIVTRTADDRVLPKNKYRIDVQEDRAPRVAFEEPEEALEVHPVAEVRKRIRISDDFGVTKAGIVFRFGDGEEKTLILKDFALEKGKKPLTSAMLEETLLMETLAATPQDSVTYYAFAEDNFPAGPRRSETDLRYIDVRPFKRDYKLADPAAGAPGEPDELATLEELIGRQRFNLNRAHRLAKHKATDRIESEDPLKIAGFEETLLGMTREFTEGIERLADARVEALHKAEEAMLASVEALDRGRNGEAPVGMTEALKNLVAARRELQTIIGGNPSAAQAMRSFDRKQAQKIRKPKGKDEEAEQVAAELEDLAKEEDFVYASLAGLMETGPDGKAEKGERGQDGEKKDAEEPKDEAKKDGEPKDAEAKKDGQSKGQNGSKGQGPKGMKGSKGQGKGEEGEGGESKSLERRKLTEKQEEIADTARMLEEKLKRIEAASDLAKARMAKAAEKAERASGALARGNTKEAAEDARKGAGMLHDLARQVKGEISREVADELAMARDLAEELADRESELADMKDPEGSGGDSEKPGKDGQGQKPGDGKGSKPGKGKGSRGGAGWSELNEAERMDRMAEMARTLEAWLKQIDAKGEGRAADAVKEILERGAVAEIVEKTERMGEVRVGTKPADVSKDARDLAGKLERIGQTLELVHRGIVSPQIAAMIEFDRRVAALTAKLAQVKTDGEITAWHREASALIRDLEKAGIAGAADLADALRDGGWKGASGAWHWTDGPDHRVAPGAYTTAMTTISSQIKDQIQDMILKDLASARDEVMPPKFKEMVERYYEVLSKGGGGD
ncbi:MAG: hypothetical protein JWN86_1603 [Planctomycetota bacterium]|nr:hypothetical protein [Planctomycetota bacterium]